MSDSGTGALHLLCRIGGTTVAFPAASVEAVVKVDAIVAVPGAPAAVRGLAAIRSRLLTVVDCSFLVGATGTDNKFMAVITVAGHGYGLLLESVVDVVPLERVQPLPGRADPAWSKLQPMLGDHAGEPVLVIESERFVDASQWNFPQAA